ncbi:putative mitochondrial protein [Tanacetum coccineum]
MVVSTRNSLTDPTTSSSLVLDDATKRFLVETIADNQQMGNRGPQLNHSRLAKIEFPKFSGDNVKGWALLWHSQFVRTHGNNVSWNEYKQAILTRFGKGYDDPMFELKILKYETTAREYEDAFDNILSRVEVSKEHVVSLFIGGLPTEIEMGVRMFKPKTLADAYCLANLQEATLNVVKKKTRPPFIPSTSRFNGGSTNTSKPLMTNSTNASGIVNTKPNTPVTRQNRRFSQKEYAEKRAQNLCFYYDQKYVPRYKCSSQLYSLVLVPEEDSVEGEFLETDETLVDTGLIVCSHP